MGLYYSPPQPNIGNQQPLQQKLLDPPQSGPLAANPPIIGSFIGQAILVSWAMAVAVAGIQPVVARNLNPPISGPAAQAPLFKKTNYEIYRAWDAPTPAPIVAASFVPQGQAASFPFTGSVVPAATFAWNTAPAYISLGSLDPPASGPSAQNSPILGTQVPVAVQVAWLPQVPAPIVAINLNPPVSGPAPPNPALNGVQVPVAVQLSWLAAPPALWPNFVADDIAPIVAGVPAASFVPYAGAYPAIAISWTALVPAPIVAVHLNPPISGPAPQNPPFAGGARIGNEVLNSWLPPAPMPIMGPKFTLGTSVPSNPPFGGSRVPLEVQISWLPGAPAPIAAVNGVPVSAPSNPPVGGAVLSQAILASWQVAPSAPIVAALLNPPLSAPQNPPFAGGARLGSEILIGWLLTAPVMITGTKLVAAAAVAPPPAGFPGVPAAVQIAWLPQVTAPIVAVNLNPPVSGPLPSNPPFAGGAQVPLSVQIAWLPPQPAPIVEVTFDPWLAQPVVNRSTGDPAIVAAYRRGFARLGVSVQVTFTRNVGVAPNVTSISATVSAVVRNYQPDTESVARTGGSPTRQGAITQGDRMLIVMAADLSNAAFPLPLKKNDKATLAGTGEELNIIAVDAEKRAAAGAIEIRAAGVQ